MTNILLIGAVAIIVLGYLAVPAFRSWLNDSVRRVVAKIASFGR